MVSSLEASKDISDQITSKFISISLTQAPNEKKWLLLPLPYNKALKEARRALERLSEAYSKTFSIIGTIIVMQPQIFSHLITTKNAINDYKQAASKSNIELDKQIF